MYIIVQTHLPFENITKESDRRVLKGYKKKQRDGKRKEKNSKDVWEKEKKYI
jgi:hypothetical protein